MSLAHLTSGQDSFSIFKMISEPAIEIGGSLLLGLALGIVLVLVAKKSSGRDELQAVALVAIGIATGLSNSLGLSPLLTNIMMGTILINMYPKSKRVFNSVNDFSTPVYILFFTLAGASLDLSILLQVGMLGIAYVIARASGKILGAWLGANLLKNPTVTKISDMHCFPGGISIGLLVLVRSQLSQFFR